MLTLLIALPPLAFSRSAARLVARAAAKFGIESARISHINLLRCFPDQSQESVAALVRDSLCHTACLMAEAGMLAHWSRERIQRCVLSLEGIEPLRECLRRSQSVLLLVPHFGNWEMITFVLGGEGLVAVYDPPRISALEGPIKESRERFGATLVPTDRAGLRAVYRALKHGGLIGILPDQVPDTSAGVHAPFFGHPALTMTFAHRLIRQTSPAVFIGSATRAKGGFHVRIVAAPAGVCDEDVSVHAASLNAAIEELVLTDPGQYQWEYKRFKRQPQDMEPVYPKVKANEI
ncbi:MAG: lysophospholipid acyltransferase family protein [Pseudomonadales bacterium]|nr:lysophospholipid acyltransferase family protein [Pseudomonadales bacterium]MDP6471432.1 lysophospholipid acyltransferase family protein [Pseudomonadales bacterium]MDP6828601.1 lysophospholipid acyltransferase family protein [Pseudomonadales bacterium]MDP6973216.1 lysophospholipid acyltransferase family protein [Pseudomonadales bacterium]